MNIDDIRKRAEAATPLPWCIGNIQNLDDCDKSNIIQCVYGDTIAYVPEPRYSSNADFIAHARQDVPYLLAEYDKLMLVAERAKRLYASMVKPAHKNLLNRWLDLGDALKSAGIIENLFGPWERELEANDDMMHKLREENEKLKTIRAEGEQDWDEIIKNPDGTLNEEQIMKELSDFSFVLSQVPKVYCHITGDKWSKPNYYADDIIKEADDHITELCDDAIADETSEQKAEIDALRGMLEKHKVDSFYECVECGARLLANGPHAPDCELNKLLKGGE